jgi:LPS export ABC transporter protein LptC
MIRSLLPVLVLIALALLSTVYLSRLEADLRPDTAVASRAPKLLGSDLMVTTMAASGLPSQRLVAASAVEGPRASGTDLVAPRMILYEDGAPATTARARNGWLSSDHELLLLLDSVQIDNLAGDGRTEGRLTTEYLEVYPNDRQALTDRPVRLTSPGHVVDAVGLRADFERNIVELLSKVRGRHEINSR